MSRSTLQPANDDTIQCLFYSTKLAPEMLLWEELSQQINNTVKSLSKDYIWHRDEFQVYFPMPLSDTRDTGSPFYLHSSTCFGDNIEDEWFIVHLVLEISRQYKDLIIQLIDNDGDFLLIEAADYLQTWMKPDNTENRVFIYSNNIHIIPPYIIPLGTKVELNTALKIINESPEKTKASCEIEQAILSRIGKYPDKVINNIHKSGVYLPTSLAALLVLKPALIAPLVDAYCNHDTIDAKSCKNIDFSDCVTIEVKFTKFLYAKLMHSKLSSFVEHYASSQENKNALGVKLTCGYQMITNKAKTDLFSTKEYHIYVNSLKKNGYFKNNIEGSKEYTNLLNKAKEYFAIVESPINSKLSYDIHQTMSSNDYIRIKDSIENYLVNSEYTGDSEDWLNINPEQLNDLLMSRYGKTSKLKNNDVISSQVVTKELSCFLKQTSDYEGIEPDHNESSEDDNIQFESDEFIASLEKMLNIISSGHTENDNGSDDEDMEFNEDIENDCDIELKAQLQQDQTDNIDNSNAVFANLIQSIEEEKASTGPTSNLLRNIGIYKSNLLDSDDDDVD